MEKPHSHRFIIINQDGVTIIAPRAEMGQGVHTVLASMVAEELDVALADVNVIHGPASAAYFNEVLLEEQVPFAQTDTSSLAEGMRNFTHIPAKLLGMQVTGGSSSVPDAFEKMRVAGAAAREVLLKAAAQRLSVSVDQLTTDNGKVVAPNGDVLSYSELAQDAAEIEPSAEPVLKPQSEWKILGKSTSKN